MTFDLFLILVALVSFALAALQWKPSVQWVAIGLFALTLTILPGVN